MLKRNVKVQDNLGNVSSRNPATDDGGGGGGDEGVNGSVYCMKVKLVGEGGGGAK